MNCPACGTEESAVTQTLTMGKRVDRRRVCECGARWGTCETMVKGTLITGPPSLNLSTNTQGEIREGENLGLVSRSSGPDPSSPGNPIRARVERKGRGDAKEYTAEFEKLWAACKGRRGNKEPAFKVWLKLKPDTTLTVAKYNQMLASLEPWRTAKNFSTWLNAKGWQDEYEPYRPAPASNGHRPLSFKDQERAAREERDLDARADLLLGARR